MNFTSDLRSLAAQLWQRSFDHPFVNELCDGTLPEDVFAHYVRNDAYYLRAFARVHALACARTSDATLMSHFAQRLQTTLKAEQELHETFFELLGISGNVRQTAPAPTAYRYATHLLSVASDGSVAEIAASTLPCYWLYGEIGRTHQYDTPNHPIYDLWVAAYGAPWYATVVEEQIALVNELADRASQETRARMTELFLISSQYELEFWQMAYVKETWAFVSPLDTSR